MTRSVDLVLIVDDDPEVRALLREQVLASRDFQTLEAKDGPAALALLRQHSPDLVLLDLHLPGLDGHDVLVALRAQGYQGPVIALGERTSPRPAVDAFRLGATDYITKPIREAEALAVIERGLAEAHLRRQRNALLEQLQTANHQLEARLAELTALYEIGASVVALRDLERLMDIVLHGAITVTGADHVTLLLRDDQSGQLILRAGKNLPLALLDRMGEAVRDQLAELVMTSREALSVAGESLRRFPTSRDLYAAVYVPLTVQTTAIGVLAVGNHRTHRAFDDNHVRLLKVLGDYAAIALVNARLFSMVEQRNTQMQALYREVRERDAQRGRQLQLVVARLRQPLGEIEAELGLMAHEGQGRLPQALADRLAAMQQRVQRLVGMVTSLGEEQERTDAVQQEKG